MFPLNARYLHPLFQFPLGLSLNSHVFSHRKVPHCVIFYFQDEWLLAWTDSYLDQRCPVMSLRFHLSSHKWKNQ